MQRYTLFLGLFVCAPILLTAQKPSLNQSEWQQRANHQIEVELYYDSGRAYLEGNQQIEYFNNSPDTMNEIFLHLWPNAYKNNTTPFAQQQAAMNKKEFLLPHAKKGNIEISDVKVNGNIVAIADAETEIAKIVLQQPILPHSSVKITMKFNVLVPPFYSRMGATSDFISATQWYPKPAVYDVNGWNTMPYLDQGEFYSEFGDYDVTITTPADFLVAAGGNLTTESEIEYLKNLSDYYLDSITLHDFNKLPKMSRPVSPWKDKRVVNYILHNAHDFAWFASPKFQFISDTVKLSSDKVVETQYYSVSGTSKSDLIAISESLRHYSNHVGDYPYDVCKVVIGPLIAGGGMEYPTITICASNDFSTVMHEIGHNWFYGALGSNEREFPWMDESVNSFYENLYTTKKLSNYKLNSIKMIEGKGSFVSHYLNHLDKILDLNYRRMGESQSGDLPAYEYNSKSYYSVIYGRMPHGFAYLYEYLGENVFQKAMHDYYNQWKFKHPLPKDMQNAFENSTNMDLSWFFENMFQDYKGTDFKVNYVKKISENRFEVSLSNRSNLKIPLQYGFYQKIGNNSDIIETGFIPAFSKDTTITINAIYSNIYYFLLDPYQLLPENNRENDLVHLASDFRKYGSGSYLKFKFFQVIENQFQRQLIVQPAITYNLYSGWGVGLNMYNRVFPFKKAEFSITPFYALHSKNVVGTADLVFNFRVYDSKIFGIKTGVDFTRFDFRPVYSPNVYNKINPYIVIKFKTKGIASERFKKELKIQGINVFCDNKSYSVFNTYLDTSYIMLYPSYTSALYLRTDYSHIDYHAVNPQSFNIGLEGGLAGLNQGVTDEYLKMDFNYKIEQILKGKGRGMKAEFNAGFFLYKTQGMSGIYLFRGSGNTGTYDYLFKEKLIGRNERLNSNIWAQQLITQGGDMRINAPSLMDNAFTSLKLETSLPLLPIVRLYTDMAVNPLRSKSKLFAVGGVSLVLAKDILEVYFPLVYTDNFKQFYDLNNIDFAQRICFKMNLDIVYFRKNIEKSRNILGY
ncbi:MAG: M1 family metallopeptidase [Bacteroidetes bacterium]|nr:M1 family metallopeptidase [Bacteroidota bacterium]